jgi:hypothetical protein
MPRSKSVSPKSSRIWSSKTVLLKKGKRKYHRKKMLTPRQLRNFVYENTLQDWLERHHIDREKYKEPAGAGRKSRDFQTQFREHVINQLRSRVEASELIVLNRPDTNGIRSGEAMAKLLNGKETLQHMRDHVPVIANAQLVNRSEALCDIADLLVRSDYIHRIFPLSSMTVSKDTVSKFGQWYYVVVGIRFGQHQFCVDGVKLRNDPSIRYWKTKLYIQNRILNHYQQCDVDAALLVGRGYTWTVSKGSKGSKGAKNNTINKPGTILFESVFDGFTDDILKKGTEWINKLDAPLSAEWKTVPEPSVPELYANGKLSVYDTPWAPVIHDIAVAQDEITLLHHCTTKSRQTAHSKNLPVHGLSGLRTSEDVGYKSTTKIGSLINRYIAKDWNLDISLPPRATVVLFLDFESLPVGTVKFIDDSTYIKEWIYLASITDYEGQSASQFGLTELPAPGSGVTECTESIERSVAKGVYDFLFTANLRDACFQIYCWGDAEARYLYKLEEKYPEYPIGTLYACRLVNLHEIFVNGDIMFPGQTDNTLETVSRVMGLSCKVPINTNQIVQDVMWNSDLGLGTDANADPKRQGLLDQLLRYGSNDTTILREMVQKIYDEQQFQPASDSFLENTSSEGD